MNLPKNQKGLAPILIIIILAAIGVGVVIYSKQASVKPPPSSNKQSQATASAQIKPTTSPITKSKNSIPVTPTSTPKPSATPASAPTTPSVSNPYDLNSPTGAVKVLVKPQSGELGYAPLAELSAVSGFKVFDGRSKDKITQYGRSGSNPNAGEITFSTAPPGPYKIRISYNGQWSDQKDISVSSAQQTTVEFSVAGQTPAPTPTPVPKTVCQANIVSKSSESAPSTVTLAAGATIVLPPNLKDKYITAVQWDYNGDGAWDTEMSYSLQGIITKNYDQPGDYNVKARVQLSDGEITDTCSSSFSLK